MSIIRNRLYQFKQELLSNKDRAWYSHTNLLTAVDLLITDLDNLDESDWIRVNDEMPVERDSMFAKFKGTNKWKTGMFEKVSRNVLVTVECKVMFLEPESWSRKEKTKKAQKCLTMA